MERRKSIAKKGFRYSIKNAYKRKSSIIAQNIINQLKLKENQILVTPPEKENDNSRNNNKNNANINNISNTNNSNNNYSSSLNIFTNIFSNNHKVPSEARTPEKEISKSSLKPEPTRPVRGKPTKINLDIIRQDSSEDENLLNKKNSNKHLETAPEPKVKALENLPLQFFYNCKRVVLYFQKTEKLKKIFQTLYDKLYPLQNLREYEILYHLEPINIIENKDKCLNDIIEESDSKPTFILRKRENYCEDILPKKSTIVFIENFPSYFDLSVELNNFFNSELQESEFSLDFRNSQCAVSFLNAEKAFALVLFLTKLKINNPIYKRLKIKLDYKLKVILEGKKKGGKNAVKLPLLSQKFMAKMTKSLKEKCGIDANLKTNLGLSSNKSTTNLSISPRKKRNNRLSSKKIFQYFYGYDDDNDNTNDKNKQNNNIFNNMYNFNFNRKKSASKQLISLNKFSENKVSLLGDFDENKNKNNNFLNNTNNINNITNSITNKTNKNYNNNNIQIPIRTSESFKNIKYNKSIEKLNINYHEKKLHRESVPILMNFKKNNLTNSNSYNNFNDNKQNINKSGSIKNITDITKPNEEPKPKRFGLEMVGIPQKQRNNILTRNLYSWNQRQFNELAEDFNETEGNTLKNMPIEVLNALNRRESEKKLKIILGKKNKNIKESNTEENDNKQKYVDPFAVILNKDENLDKARSRNTIRGKCKIFRSHDGRIV